MVYIVHIGICVYSCYVSPSFTILQLEDMLDRLNEDASGRMSQVIIAEFMFSPQNGEVY